MFNKKSILITGGTGSFGHKFVEKIIKKYKPKKLIIFSRDEFKQNEMEKKFPSKKYSFLRFFLGDIRDKERLLAATKDLDYIVHAAALKQVVAAEYNPWEFVKTNVYGSQNVIDCAIENKVEKVISLSTDKAADPINLYGATKFTSDKLMIAGNNISGNVKTKFSVVRYGNVSSSRGSVIPLFKSLIEKRAKELPITDKEMTRFWITLEESVDFVINSFYRMLGGEIFIPKIKSFKITDLADVMAPKLKKKIIGIRPGEKIDEILCPRNMSKHTVKFKNYYSIIPSINLNKINFLKNYIGETGKFVKQNFEFSSGDKSNMLTNRELKKKLDELYN